MLTGNRCFLRTLLDTINPYAWIMAARNKAFDKGIIESRSFGTPTICIGNISVGGTGKTPHTEYIIKLLKEKYRTAMLSRGYGRKSKGYIRAGANITMELIGDEPMQIRNKFPDIAVAVCEKRVEGIERLTAEQPSPQAILLDDAYQHRHVKAGLYILLIDSNRPIWHDCVLPFGRLRERISGIKRADVAIITKCKSITHKEAEECREQIKRYKNIPVFFSAVRYGELYSPFGINRERTKISPGNKVLLVTGIAKPQPLKAEIKERGAKVSLIQYGDHHNFGTAELEDIARRYKTEECNIIVTTEKDASRLLQRTDLPQIIRDNIYVLPIEVKILNGEEKMFNQIIENYVTKNSRNS